MNHPLPAVSPVRTRLTGVFWVALAVFIAWDFQSSDAIDLRDEPPLLAAGSGRAATGGHCSMSK